MSEIDRPIFVSVLKKLAPALSSKDLVPAFSCFCFGEKSVYAYDDIVALQFTYSGDFVPEIRGGVKGKILLEFLEHARANALNIEMKETSVLVKAGRAKLETPVVPEKDFIFQSPDTKKAVQYDLDKDFLSALGKAAISLGKDPAHPFRLGVTVIFSETGSIFYASNNVTAIKVILGKYTPPAEGEAEATILPPRFVELLLELGKEDPPTKIFVDKGWAEARFTSGLKLFTRTIAAVDITSFQQLFSNIKERKGVAHPIPSGFDRCLQQAAVVIPYAKPPVTTLSVEEGKLKMVTKSNAGDINLSVPFEGELEGEAPIVPAHALVCLGFAQFLTIYPDCLVFTVPKTTYMVAVYDPTQVREEATETPA